MGLVNGHTEGGLSLAKRLRRLMLGGARDPRDPAMYHKISLIAFFAWVGLGADGLSSSCYGPAEAFGELLHGQAPHLAVFVALGTAFTVTVIAISYSQIVELFPTGGGGYLVASRLLSPTIGMVSGCALIIDYVLTIALSIASGRDAIFSFLPLDWHFLRLWVAVVGVLILTALNMRGVKESVIPLLPVFMVFVITHAFAIVYILGGHVSQLGAVTRATAAEASSLASEIGVFGVLFVVLRAYSMGAGTYTGIEAVSNGLPILREPKVHTARRTMLYMVSSLIVMVVGLMLAYVLVDARFQTGKTLNAVVLEAMTANWGRGLANAFVFITLFSEAAILFVAAQTGFIDAPRVLSYMALDRWAPTRFATLSDRLVTQNGVVMTGTAALAILLIARGSVQYLIVLYSITVFITFVLSQLSMVRHWWTCRKTHGAWKKGLCINGLGLVLTSFILVSVIIAKFGAGGWITLVIAGGLVVLAVTIRRHYRRTYALLGRLDSLVSATMALVEHTEQMPANPPQYQPEGKTAIVLVNGFNGLGLHGVFSIVRLFGGAFRNFIFLQVGAVDAGVFKGAEEIDSLEYHIKSELARYVKYMNLQGYYAEGVWTIGTDIVEEVSKMAPRLIERFPQGIFFAGQLVFPEETWFTRMLHNYVVFAVQRRLYSRGIPFMILPVRV